MHTVRATSRSLHELSAKICKSWRSTLRYLVQGGRNTAVALKKVGRREKGARRIGVEAIGKKADQLFATELKRCQFICACLKYILSKKYRR